VPELCGARRKCNPRALRRRKFRAIPAKNTGTNFALIAGVRNTRRIGKAILMFVPILICGARLHAGAFGGPAGITQEVCRCLNLVRVAASRRSGRQRSPACQRPLPRAHSRQDPTAR
jgi:hypothetical protein